MGVFVLALGIFGTGGLVTQVHDELSKSVRSAAPVISEDSANDTVSLLSDFKRTGKQLADWSRVANLLASSDLRLFCQQQNALEILKALPTIQQRTYELSVDEKAKGAYTEAKKKDDPEAMLKVALAYPIHRAGKDALNWLGTYMLNRGEFGSAHTFYQELTRGEEAKKADEKIWVKAALAAHRVGDTGLRDAAFEVLKERKTKIRVGDETLDADGIKKEILEGDGSGRKLTKNPSLALEHLKEALDKPYASAGFNPLHARWLARHSPALLKKAASQLANPRKLLSVSRSEYCAVMKEREVSCFAGTMNLPRRVFRKPIKQLIHVDSGMCVLLSDGTVWCWEPMEETPATEIKEFSEAKEIGGTSALCAVHGNAQKVSCAEGVPLAIRSTGYSSLKQISVFTDYGCGIETKSGEIRCWEGRSAPRGILTPPKGKKGSQVAVGYQIACILTEGKPDCWGNKHAVSSVPAGLKDITALALGYGLDSGSCALTKEEKVICWGEDKDEHLPPPKGLEGVLRISTNGMAVCADTRNQGVVCWGAGTKTKLRSRAAVDLQQYPFLNQIPACERKK